MKLARSQPKQAGARILADYGGTWIRVWAADSKGRILRSLQKPSPPPGKIPLFLKSVLKKWLAENPSSLLIGARGFWKNEKKARLHGQLKNLAGTVRVLSDVEMAHLAAFGARPGILILAGTGSIAFGKNGFGRFARAGGLGPKKGDEGSAYWIGKEYTVRTGRKITKNIRKTALTAPLVIGKASSGDPLSNEIVQEAHIHLGKLVWEVQNKLGIKKPICVSVAGGLFKSQFFKKGFLLALKKSDKDSQIRMVQPPDNFSKHLLPKIISR